MTSVALSSSFGSQRHTKKTSILLGLCVVGVVTCNLQILKYINTKASSIGGKIKVKSFSNIFDTCHCCSYNPGFEVITLYFSYIVFLLFFFLYNFFIS